MKKKLFAFLLAPIACVGILFAFTACDGTSSGGNHSVLKTDKKYSTSHTYSSTDISQTWQQYYIFHGNGTGEFYNYSKSTATVPIAGFNHEYEYTVHFKYTFVDSEKEAVVCFYDSVEYGSRNEDGNVDTDWDEMLTVSENVLCSASSNGYTFYVCEDYLPQIPNYNS